jgi:hypothetical protein
VRLNQALPPKTCRVSHKTLDKLTRYLPACGRLRQAGD